MAEREPLLDARGEAALLAWCEAADYDPEDRDAPHVEAFLAGYECGYEDGHHKGLRDGWTG